MKSIGLFIYIFILITTFSVHGFSQTTASKMVVVDTDMFKNKQRGIKEVVEAYDKLEAEFKSQNDELNLIAEKAKKLAKEIYELVELNKKSGMWVCGSKLPEKTEEFANLQIEYKAKDDKRRSSYEKRKAEIFVEADKKIQTALIRFAKDNNFETIYEFKGLEEISRYVCSGGDKLNVTDKFIVFYNKNYAENK